MAPDGPVGGVADLAGTASRAVRACGRQSLYPAWLNSGDCVPYAVSAMSRVPLRFKGGDFGQMHVITFRNLSGGKPVPRRKEGVDAGMRRHECVRDGALSARCESVLGLVAAPLIEGHCVAVRRGGEQPEVN